MKSTVYCPGHITGFFEICMDEDPALAGSRGCGVVIDKGVETTVKAREADENIISITMNGEDCGCPVTRAVADEVLEMAGGSYELEIHHRADVPSGYGFGASAAGALGTAFALKEALVLDLPREILGRAAHKAEVTNRTGLGDVIAEMTGGLAVRTEPGAPGVGKTERIPYEGEVVCFIIGDKIDTKGVLTSDRAGIISDVGAECLARLMADRTPENFMRLSREFAARTGLLTGAVKEAVDELDKKGITASMAMLGNAVFCLTEEPEDVIGHLDYPVIRAGLSDGLG